MMAATTPNITPNNNGSLQQRNVQHGLRHYTCNFSGQAPVLQNRRFVFLLSQISPPGSVDNINNSLMMIIVMVTMKTIIKLSSFICVFAESKWPITQQKRDKQN